MKRFKVRRLVWIVLTVLVAFIIVYYGYEVIAARQNTQQIVADIWASGRIELPLNELSLPRQEMLLKIEDPAFYHHHGVDFVTPGAGWTTITQSLAKRFYFEDFEQGIMKIKQTLCAWLALDPLVDKQTQLTLYINISYFGNGAYGLSDAAATYFGKRVSELTDDEFLSLIASLISPNELNIADHPQENAQRVTRIHKVLSGEYTPDGLFDITYEGAD